MTPADSAATGADIEDFCTRSVLGPGERILWRGRPNVLAAMLPEAIPALAAIPFLGAGAMFAANGDTTLLLFGLGAIAAGLWLAASPLRSAARAKRTYYAVTDRRALILEARSRGIDVHAIAPGEMGEYTQRGSLAGGDDIIFRRTVRHRRGRRTAGFADAFWGIDDSAAGAAIAALGPGAPAPRATI